MKEQFVTYDIAVKLKELGFKERCFGSYYSDIDKNLLEGSDYRKYFQVNYSFSEPHETEEDAWYIINGEKEYYVAVPLWQQIFDWFEKEHKLSGEVLCQAAYDSMKQPYWWYMIQDGTGKDISDWQERHANIMQKAHQDIEGNYLNDELFAKYIFEDKFAFNTRLKAKEECIYKLIDIVNERLHNQNI